MTITQAVTFEGGYRTYAKCLVPSALGFVYEEFAIDRGNALAALPQLPRDIFCFGLYERFEGPAVVDGRPILLRGELILRSPETNFVDVTGLVTREEWSARPKRKKRVWPDVVDKLMKKSDAEAVAYWDVQHHLALVFQPGKDTLLRRS